jgi:hypothetical protein
MITSIFINFFEGSIVNTSLFNGNKKQISPHFEHCCPFASSLSHLWDTINLALMLMMSVCCASES